MKRITGAFAAACALAVAACAFLRPSFAEESVADLKQQIAALQKRVDTLEAGRPQGMQAATPAVAPGAGNWDPFDEMQRMQDEVGRMFQDSFLWAGPVGTGVFGSNMNYEDNFNVKEDKDKYVVTFDLAGLDQNKVDIEVNEHSITVTGEYSQETRQKGESEQVAAKSYGSFLRSIPVPEDADTTKMQTDKQGEKLVITLPKKAAAAGQKK
ncbi:MAG: Hsp20/alpha crystallin family protein [Deltaproteobacteria bacterium]